ncbi:hypothetical protein ACU8OR_30055 (plasmid) [Rhizobium leguminosarum]
MYKITTISEICRLFHCSHMSLLWSFVIFPVLAAVPSNSFGADDLYFRTVPVEDSAGFELGRGFDLLTGNPRQDCVDRTVVDSHADFGPDAVTFSSTEVTRNDDLDRSLNVSASASVQGGFGSASASTSFARALHLEAYSLSYVVRASLSGKGKGLRDVVLKPNYLKLLQSKDQEALQRFRLLCGDGYIGEFIEGGEFNAVVQIHTTSQSQRESLSAAVSATISMASGSASFASTVASIAKTNDVKVWTFRRGGSGTPIAITPESIATQASSLPALVQSSPAPLRMAVFSYVTLLDDPDIRLLDLNATEAFIQKLRVELNDARDREAEIRYILSHAGEFYANDSDLPKLLAELGELVKFEAYVHDNAIECIGASGSCSETIPALPAVTVRPGRR